MNISAFNTWGTAMTNMSSIYTYKNKKYTRRTKKDKCASMKETTSGEWVDAVLYSPFGDPTTIYVREKNDFYRKFQCQGNCND